MFDFLDDLFDTTANENFTVDEVLSSGMVYLSSLNPGDKFYIGNEVYIMLEDTGNGGCRVVRKDLIRPSRIFGDDANWTNSPIREYLNEEYYEQLSSVIGSDNIIQFRRDLTSWDGLDDFGECVDKVSLLTTVEYAKYHKILGIGIAYLDWWWTITPFSAPSNGYSRCVCCVYSNGTLSWSGCDCCGGVRPFLILKSSLLVSLFSESEES